MDDLISRQAAIDAIVNELDSIDHVPEWVFGRMKSVLHELPSAQPEPLTINFARELDRETIEKLKEGIKNAPVLVMAVNDDSAQERKTGRWIRTRTPLTGAIEHRCSRCDTPYYMAFAMEMNYCPSCGAKMEVEHETDKG